MRFMEVEHAHPIHSVVTINAGGLFINGHEWIVWRFGAVATRSYCERHRVGQLHFVSYSSGLIEAFDDQGNES